MAVELSRREHEKEEEEKLLGYYQSTVFPLPAVSFIRGVLQVSCGKNLRIP
jgi:hypothetical protein